MDNASEKPQGTSFLAWLNDHVFTKTLLAILTIVGFILSIYFYKANIAKPELTYYISSTRTAIVQSGKLDNLTLSYFGNNITTDLSSAEIQIWNAGKQPITKEDIRKPVALRTQHGEPIYKTTITTTRDVVTLDLINNANHPAGVIPLNWNILEQNDGIKLQIIYGGGVDVPITVDGVIKGQQQGITQSPGPSSKRQTFLDKSFFTILLLFLTFLAIMVLANDVLSRKKKNAMPMFNWIFLFTMLPFLIFFIAMLFHLTNNLALDLSLARPPFGF